MSFIDSNNTNLDSFISPFLFTHKTVTKHRHAQDLPPRVEKQVTLRNFSLHSVFSRCAFANPEKREAEIY